MSSQPETSSQGPTATPDQSDPTAVQRRTTWSWLTAVAGGGLLALGAVLVTTAVAADEPSATTTKPEAAELFRPGGTESEPSTGLEVTPATDEQEAGVVLIETRNGYTRSGSAGTGIVLTEDGLVLTNNHVVEGATQIQVTDASTGRAYAATVVGADATADIAVLELDGADDLTVAELDDDGDPDVGDEVTGVGNAYGGGELVAAPGTVTALEQGVTTQSGYGSLGETLTGMIEIDADIVSGDSGGPLLDDEGEVVGVNTAASDSARRPVGAPAADVTAYAIPIDDAMEVVDAILAGDESDSVTIGSPAFLGVQLVPADGGGAVVSGVVGGTPAHAAGLQPGDTIIAVDGTRVGSADDVRGVLEGYEPGDIVELSWIDTYGQQHTEDVKLAAGPAA